MQTYSEKYLLLTIDPASGRSFPLREQILHLTLAGALLFDASFGGFINDDIAEITVLRTDSGDPVLDEALHCLLAAGRSLPLQKALGLVAAHGATLHRMTRESLRSKQLIARQRGEIFQHSPANIYLPDSKQVIDIHNQIRHVVTDSGIPDYRLPPLISLLSAGGLIRSVLKPSEYTSHRERIEWLAGMESLGRAISAAVKALRSEDLGKGAAGLVGLKHRPPRAYAGGMDAVLTALSHVYREAGISRGRRLIASFNQTGGFECPGCAWPNPHGRRSPFEFCENGAKSVSAEATTRTITRDFFGKWPVSDLLQSSGPWLEQQGRLTEPMLLEEGATHYRPVGWEEAFRIVAEGMRRLAHPDEAVFYATGKSSNESAFLWQLLARSLGTNNLPSSANLCHEPSGRALAMSLGHGKSSVTLEDFPKADAIFLFGHNPGSNHPRMLTALQAAVRKGCRIVAVNPMPEASLMGFANPQEPGSWLGRQTPLAHLYIQPKINGDMALVRGIVKAILGKGEPQLPDPDFLSEYTTGFDDYLQLVKDTPWETLELASGVGREQMEEAAGIYRTSKSVIASWCLGIVHHRNAVETIREIINLMLLGGNIGRPGAGLCPVRGHSNIQGIRSSGAGEEMPAAFLDALEKNYGITAPRRPGYSAVPAIRAMAAGKVKVLLSLGGNLASSLPDTGFTEEALRQTDLTVMISTKLNRSHLVTGRRALILPCLARTEEDLHNSIAQEVTIEDSMGLVSLSKGCLEPVSPNLRSEVSIIAGIAGALWEEGAGFNWQRAGNDYQFIRSEISRNIQALKNLFLIPASGEGIRPDNPLRKRVFPTPGGKALFACHPLTTETPGEGELLLMTIRSHDQFNTSVFGLNDRYRGIAQERKVLFMNRLDMERRGIAAEQPVNICSEGGRMRGGEEVRKLEGYYAVPYPIKEGCVAAYFPEANVLVPVGQHGELCATPAYKSVRVRVKVM